MAPESYLILLLDSFSNETHRAFYSPFSSKHNKLSNLYAPEKFSFKLNFLPTTKEINSEWFLVYNEPFQNINYFGFEFSLEGIVSVLSATPWWSFFLMYTPFFFALLWGVGFFVINFISVERSRIICLIMLSAFSLILLCLCFYAAVITPKLDILNFYSFNDIIYLNGGSNKTPLHSKFIIPNYKNKQSAALLNYLSKDDRLTEILQVKPVAIENKTESNYLFGLLQYTDLPHLKIKPQYADKVFNVHALNSQNNQNQFTTLFEAKDKKHVYTKINALMTPRLYSTLNDYPQTISEGFKFHNCLDENKKHYIARAWYSNHGMYNPSSKEHILVLLSGCCWSVLVSLLGCIGVSYKPNKNRLHFFTTLKNNLKLTLKNKFYYKLKMRDIYYVHGGAGCMEWSALEKLPKQKKLKHVFEDMSKFTFKDLYHTAVSAFYTRAPYTTVLVCLIAAAAALPLNSPATSLFFLNILLYYFIVKAKYPFILKYFKDLKVFNLFKLLYTLQNNSKQSVFSFFTKTVRFSMSEVLANSLFDYNVFTYCKGFGWQERVKYILIWFVCAAPIGCVFYLKPNNFSSLSTELFLKILMAVYAFVFLLCFIRNDMTSVAGVIKLDKFSLFFLKSAALTLFYLLVSYLLFVVFHGLVSVAKVATDYNETRIYGSLFAVICLAWISVFYSKHILFFPVTRKLYTLFVLFFYVYTVGDFQYTPYILTTLAGLVIATRAHSAWHKNNTHVFKVNNFQLFDSLALCVLILIPSTTVFIHLTGAGLPLEFFVNVLLASIGVSLLHYFFFFSKQDWKVLKPLFVLLPFTLASWYLCSAMGSFVINAPGVFYRTNTLLESGWVLYVWLWSCLFLWRIVKYCRCSELLAALILVFYPFAINLGSNWHSLFIPADVNKAVCLLFAFEFFSIIKYLLLQIVRKPETAQASSQVESVRVFSYLLAVVCYIYLSLFLCLNLFKYSTLFVIGVITVCSMYSALILCVVVITDLNRTGSLKELQGAFTGFRYLRKLFYIFVFFLFFFVCLIFCNFV